MFKKKEKKAADPAAEKSAAKAEKTNKKKAKKNNQKKKPEPAPGSASGTVAGSIPYVQVYPNGIFELENGLFSVSYRIPDINFISVSEEKQEELTELYRDFLDRFGDDVKIQLTLYNETIDENEFRSEILFPAQPDGLNHYRDEFNSVLETRMASANNSLATIKILTLTTKARDIESADEKFKHLDNNIIKDFVIIANQPLERLDVIERLEILNKIYNKNFFQSLKETRKAGDNEEIQAFSLEGCAAQGITTKDVIAPSSMNFSGSNFMLGETYGKSFSVTNYPSKIKASVLTDFAKIPCNALVSVYLNALPQDKAINLLRHTKVNIAGEMTTRQKQAIGKGYDPSLITGDLNDSKETVDDLIDDMSDDIKLYITTFLFTIFADSKEELKQQETNLKAIAVKNLLTIRPLDMLQEAGFNSCLPIGHNLIDNQRLMTSESVSAITPFDYLDIHQKGGLSYGVNAANKKLIMMDRRLSPSSNACILGMPGTGKSFLAKSEMLQVILNTEDEIYVIDPEREYVALAETMGGAVIKIAAGSKSYINPFDLNMSSDGEDKDPLKTKTQFIESVVELMVGGRFGLTPVQTSIIDRCVINVYDNYVRYLENNGKTCDYDRTPTLEDFYNELSMQPIAEAQNMALGLERYVTGSTDIFAHRTNVNINNRLTVFDIKEIGSGLTELGLLISLDHIWNKMIENAEKGKRTWIYIDEFHYLMKNETSAQYIEQIWRRARKWNGTPTAITQNVEDLLKSENSRTVINDSPYVILLGQSKVNKIELSRIFGISNAEQMYINATRKGIGLLRVGDDFIPFDNSIPTDLDIYKIMSTKAEDGFGRVS